MASSKYASVPEETTGLPKGVKYIIGNEAAERFSFYGMKAILVVFMTKYLHWMMDTEIGTTMSKAQATEWFHMFVSGTYFFPVLGALLADVLFGKYYTILWLSMVYCAGHLALAFMGGAGLSPTSWLVMGLVLIAVGAGGIKPCVSAHVGDQFGKKNSHHMTKVFQWFYFSINFGSMFSTWMIPKLLESHGPHVAFGIPGVLMAIATLTFWMGRNVFIHVPPAGMKFFKETFSKEGLSALAKLAIIYAFVAVFWSLYDQNSSSWVLQAENMDRNFLGVEWLQSQIQTVNPILVLALIPLFQFVLYPAVDKVFKLTAIRKISIGLFLTTASFVVISQAQEMIDAGQTPSIQWQLWAFVLLTSGEVMISITGLEFSYTQAPKSMKSVVMALWLFAVSLGNMFTAVVNHEIQVPGIGQVAVQVKSTEIGSEETTGTWTYKTTEVVLPPEKDADKDTDKGAKEKKARLITILGFDGKADTADDVVLHFNEFSKLTSVTTQEDDGLKAASKIIEDAFMASNEDDKLKALPLTEGGQKSIAELKDSWGNALTYTQISRNNYRIVSSGADKTPETQWDIVLKGTVSRAKKKDVKDTGYTWLERRKIEVSRNIGGEEDAAKMKEAVDKARGAIAKTEIETEITVGGQDTLEGAAYFWFWTKTIFITALIFIPVGYFFKEKSYIQSATDEETESEPNAEGTDA